MKKSARVTALFMILSMLIFSVVSLSCSRKESMSESSSDDGKDGESLTDIAYRLRNDGAPSDTFIAVQRQAVDELRRGDSPDDAVTVLNQMGLFYYVVDDLNRALAFYHEAADSLAASPLDRRSYGAIQLFGDLSLLYERIGMIEDAFRWNDSAIAEAHRQGGNLLSDLYRFRANFYDESLPDSSLRCYDKAIEMIDSIYTGHERDVLRAVIDSERGYFLLEAFPGIPDSVDRAVELIENSLPDSDFDRSPSEFSLGYGYLLQGHVDKGLKLMEEAAESFRRQNDFSMINYADTKLFESYASLGMWKKLADLYPEYRTVVDSAFNEQKRDYIIGANLQYEVKGKERDNEMLRVQLAAAREHRMWIVMLSLLVLSALALVITVIFRRYRTLRHKREIERRRLDELAVRHAQARDRLNELERDLSAGRNSNNEILSTPQLLAGENQGVFRRAFTTLYPDFIPRLRKLSPLITSNDELFCMLIYLKHTTEEISIFLGISRASVNSARYRLRKKFALAKNADFDEFIDSVGNEKP